MAGYRVFVKCLDGQSHLFNFENNTLVSTLRTTVSNCFKIPSEHLRFIYNGKQMKDGDILEYYKVAQGSTIDVGFRLVGGYLPVADIGHTAATTSTSLSHLMHNKLVDVKNTVNRLKDKADDKMKDLRDRIDRIKQFVSSMKRFAFMFKSFMSAMFAFFSIVILVRMVIGFFSKPLEFIMLGIACIVLAVTYVIYFLLSIPYFTIYIPFVAWFILFDLLPLVAYIIMMGALFIIITIFCFLLWFLNWCMDESLSSLVLCQNSAAAWYKTPNYHLGNKYERGLFCSRECFPGYYPDDTGMFCIKNSSITTPSYCPQAEAMRLYVGKRNDINYIYRDYNTFGNLKYISKSPQDRERLIKDHYMKKMTFLDKCSKSMKTFDYMPLNICSSIDSLENMNMGIDKATIKKMRQVCSQAYCNSRNNYGFCPQLEGAGVEDDSDFWKRAIHLTILIMVFVFVLMFTLCYILGFSL